MTETDKETRAAMSPLFLTLTVLFCVCLIVSNLMEIKTVALGPLTLTAGVVVFPLQYLIIPICYTAAPYYLSIVDISIRINHYIIDTFYLLFVT